MLPMPLNMQMIKWKNEMLAQAQVLYALDSRAVLELLRENYRNQQAGM